MKKISFHELLEKIQNDPQSSVSTPPQATPEEIAIRLEACNTCNDNGIPTLTEDRKCSAMTCKCCIDDIAKLKNRVCPWARWPKQS